MLAKPRRRADRFKDAGSVGADLDAGARFGEIGAPFKHMAGYAGLAQGQRCRQATNTAAGNQHRAVRRRGHGDVGYKRSGRVVDETARRLAILRAKTGIVDIER